MNTVTVYYWPKGYADAAGRKSFTCPKGQDYAHLVRVAGGSFATVSEVRDLNPRPVENFSEEYIRMMSNDNS